MLSSFGSATGHPPPGQLEEADVDTLHRLLQAELGQAWLKKLKRAQPKTKRTLQATEQRLKAAAVRLWSEVDAENAFHEADALERHGDWDGAREAYAKVMVLNPSHNSHFLDTSLRFAQLLHVMATSGGGSDRTDGDSDESKMCEQVLRHALAGNSGSSGSRTHHAILTRLAILLLQSAREEEATALLKSAGYQYRLASWIWRYASAQTPINGEGFPGVVFDNALPKRFVQHLQELLTPESVFWREHGYNEVTGSGENGYFSYIQHLMGQEKNTLDVIIRHIWEFLKVKACFPGLSEATVAEWWAHKRPHACGHQMHYDSDNEGIGGVRNPICSCVLYVAAPDGVGGPTLVTDQVLGRASLASRGWFVHPREGRMAAYDGKHLHGVIPGCGTAPASENSQRRITFMVAFWREIEARPFGADGLSGSSRPVPESAQVLEVGQRRYTWHQGLALPRKFATDVEGCSAPCDVPLPSNAPVWVTLSGDEVQEEVGLPDIGTCFQF